MLKSNISEFFSLNRLFDQNRLIDQNRLKVNYIRVLIAKTHFSHLKNVNLFLIIIPKCIACAFQSLHKSQWKKLIAET